MELWTLRSAGAFVLTLVLQAAAFPYVLLYMSAACWITAPVVYKRALALVRAEAA